MSSTRQMHQPSLERHLLLRQLAAYFDEVSRMRWAIKWVSIPFSLIVSVLILVVLAIFAAGNFVAESARK